MEIKICENCGVEHNGKYGSGRFCSIKCANGFSTKAKRKEINEKVSKTLSGRGNDEVTKICEYCGTTFTRAWNKRMVRFCTHSCRAKSMPEAVKQKIREKTKGTKMGAQNPMFGKAPSHRNAFLYKSVKMNRDILCRSSYEQRAIDILDADNAVVSFEYEYIKVPYEINGNAHITIADYFVKMKDDTYKIIEVKAKSLINMWSNDIKIAAMQDYANKNQMKFELWTEDYLFNT